jgi:hypothetical protein
MERHVKGGGLATDEQKIKYMKGFLNQTKKIDQVYFSTNKGFRLGDSKFKAIKVYGQPDSVSTTKGIERCEWDFIGDIFYDGKTDLKGKPVAKNSYGHQAIMFFKANKLIGIIFHNDIP